MKNICFIRFGPTSPHLGRWLDPWYFEKNNFKVHYWDLSNIFYADKKVKDYYITNKYKFIGPRHRFFFNIKSFLVEISKLKKNSIIIYFDRNPFHNPIIKNDISIIKAVNKFNNLFTLQFDTKPIGNKFVDKFKNQLRMIKNRIISKKFKPKFYIGCGQINKYYSKKIYPKTKFISIPSPLISWKHIKFDDYKKGSFITFIDENFFYQPDAKMYNHVFCKNPNEYYDRMNILFNYLEKNFKKKVIIAASGKYRFKTNIFEKRNIIYEKTHELINNSHFVIGHCSSAIYQTIFANIPRLLIDDISFTKRQRIENKIISDMFGGKHIDNQILDIKFIKKNISFRTNSSSIIKKNHFFSEYVSDDKIIDYRIILKKTFEEI